MVTLNIFAFTVMNCLHGSYYKNLVTVKLKQQIQVCRRIKPRNINPDDGGQLLGVNNDRNILSEIQLNVLKQ